MSFPENRQQTFPAVPPSHSAGDHEMRDYYADDKAPQPPPNQTPYLTPYLGLQARLSQVWINRWTVLLLLVLVRVLLMIASTDNSLDSARREALSACTSVESVGSAMASMPHYMSRGVNTMTAKSITKAVSGVQSMAGLTVTGVEELVVFYIGMLTNTYLCLTTFAVTGSLSAVIGAVEKAQEDLNQMTSKIGTEISDAGEDVQKGITDALNGVSTFLGAGEAPKIDFTKQLDELKNLKLPDSLFEDLRKLNDSLPTFEEVKNKTESVIRTPFRELKELMEKEMGNYTFNSSLFPVPQKEKLSFCSDNNGINDFFDNLQKIADTARKVFIATLTILAVLICAPMAWWEIKRYRSLTERARNIGQTARDPMDAVYQAQRPFTSRFGLWLAGKFDSPRKKILARWWVAYATSLPALFILSLAFAGLFACLCQYIMLAAIKRAVPDLTDQVADFAGAVMAQMDSASMSWSNGTNAVIGAENQAINENLFGWVNTSTEAVNNTLNTFIDETMNVLNATFGGTPLYNPVKEVFNCLIGLKVQGIQRGLTWVHDNVHVNFPQIDADALSLNSLDEDNGFLSDPTGSTADAISNAVIRVCNVIEKGIREEAIISTMILLVWFLLVLIGFFTTFFRSRSEESVRGVAGNEYNADPLSAPFAAPTNYEMQTSQRPQSAAPPYAPSNTDVHANGYTLRHHEIPRSSLEADVVTEKPSTSSNWPMSRNLTSNKDPQQHNEKNGFI